MAFGKKMQVCGIAVTNRIDDIDDNVFHVSSRINSTWGGNLVDMVRATKYIEIIHEEGLVDNARVVGEYLVNQLHKLSEIHPDLVFNPRGRGLYSAFSLRDTELRGRVIDNCYENGLLILSSGSTSVRFRPPLNLTKDQVDEGISIIDTSIRQALSHHRV
jgi:L-lysine 6-transaminase